MYKDASRAEKYKAFVRLRKKPAKQWCGKETYKFRKDAKRHRDRIANLRDEYKPGLKIEVYYCERCEGYHVGHSRAWIGGGE